jgi:hypothetical protein
MDTLLNGFVDRAALPRYLTIAELAERMGESEDWVRKAQDRGIIAPALTKGRIQFNLSAYYRLSFYQFLVAQCGKSAVPARILETFGPRLDAMFARSGDVYTREIRDALVEATVDALDIENFSASLDQPAPLSGPA